MALSKEQIKIELKGIKSYLESNKVTAEEKKVQYDSAFAHGWLNSTIDSVVLRIEEILSEIK